MIDSDKRCGRGSLLIKISDCGWHVISSSPVPLKTHRVWANDRRLNGRRFLIPSLDSRFRMVFLDTTGCLKGGKCRSTDSREVVGEDVATLMIYRSSCEFVFLRHPDSPRW
ncbi:hypothetical protein TNCV_826231 [Trichonephila clavipes]|nr:hypothetical protein TNCV_826231 [Trichonephila clavipes]